MPTFQERFDSFIKGCESIVAEDHKRFPNLRPQWFEIHHGSRYIKILQCNDWNKEAAIHNGVDPDKCISRRSHVYIDKTNGDVLNGNYYWVTKPKVARGNIFDDYNGLRWMGPYGPAYLDAMKIK
jgi:hypothetical protein